MTHGFKVDKVVTEAAFRNGIFRDCGSFFTLADLGGRIHVHLEGQDRSIQRQRALARAKDRCAVCKIQRPQEQLEYHHPGSCDCIDPECPTHVEIRCSQYLSDCHQHRRVGFQRKAHNERSDSTQ